MKLTFKTLLAGMLFAMTFTIASLLSTESFAQNTQDSAETLFIDAVILSAQAEKEPDKELRIKFLREAVDLLDQIITNYPNSQFAIRIRAGESLGNFDPEKVREQLRLAMTEQAIFQARTADQLRVKNRITSIVEAWLEYLRKTGASEWMLEFDGMIQVVLTGDETGSIELNNVRISSTNQDDGIIDLGNLQIYVTLKNDNESEFKIHLPDRIHWYESVNGGDALQILNRDSRVSFVWNPDKVSPISQSNFELNDLTLVLIDQNDSTEVGGIDSITFKEIRTQRDSGSEDVFALAYLENLTFRDGSENFTLGELSISTTAKELDSEKVQAIQLAFDEHSRTSYSIEEVIELLLFFKSISVNFALKELEFDASDPSNSFYLDELSTNFTLNNQDGILDLKFSVLESGLETEVFNLPRVVAFIPDWIKLDFDLSNIPFREAMLWSIHENSEIFGDFDEESLQQFLLILENANTSITINDLELKAPVYALSATGKLHVKESAEYRGLGSLTVEVSGLDKILENAEASQSQMVAPLSALVIVKLAGELAGRTSDGEAIYRYVLELLPDGSILINGTPLDLLLTL